MTTVNIPFQTSPLRQALQQLPLPRTTREQAVRHLELLARLLLRRAAREGLAPPREVTISVRESRTTICSTRYDSECPASQLRVACTRSADHCVVSIQDLTADLLELWMAADPVACLLARARRSWVPVEHTAAPRVLTSLPLNGDNWSSVSAVLPLEYET